MYLVGDDSLTYLANAIFVAQSDGSLSPKSAAALQEIRSSLGVSKSGYELATRMALSGTYSLKAIGAFAAQVSNLHDLLFLSALDEGASTTKIDLICRFAKSVGLSDEQIRSLTKDARDRRDAAASLEICPTCHSQISADNRFCPKCGSPLLSNPPPTEFQLPSSGYAIEFCESSSASFPSALTSAQKASSFSSCQRNRKTWYLATWPLGRKMLLWK